MQTTLQSQLQTVDEVSQLIRAGHALFLAASRQALSRLPRGQWIGGSIPYFMTESGGLMDEDHIFVTMAPVFATRISAVAYRSDQIEQIYRDAPENGFTFLVLPAASAVLTAFAEKAPNCDGYLFRPVVGWVAGVRVDKIGTETPAVVNGVTGEVLEDRACALHVALPAGKLADLAIVNIFEAGNGHVVRFDRTGFQVTECRIGGKQVNLADYIAANGISTEFPLVGDYSGTNINVSFQKVDTAAHSVDLYAPVFPGVDYRFAKPITDYVEAFAQKTAEAGQESSFACNCILNYLYAKLEGKKTGAIVGPITFGEIAHQLLNQTMVQLNIHDVS